MPVHFSLGYRLVNGALVEQIGSGVIAGRIAINGGRESALMVDTTDGGRVVRDSDVRRVRSS